MSKRIVKYASRIVLGLFTLFWGLITYAALTPVEGYHHCEAGQEELNPLYGIIITLASFVAFCIVWYKTKNSFLDR